MCAGAEASVDGKPPVHTRQRQLLVVGMSHLLWPGLLYRVSRCFAAEGWRVTHIYSSAAAHSRAPAHTGASEEIVVECPPPRLTNALALVRQVGEVVRRWRQDHQPDLSLGHHPSCLPVLLDSMAHCPVVYLAAELCDGLRVRPLLGRMVEARYKGRLAAAIVNNAQRAAFLRTRRGWRCPLVVLPNAPTSAEAPAVDPAADGRVRELFRSQGFEPRWVAIYSGGMLAERCVLELVRAMTLTDPALGLLLVGFRARNKDRYERAILGEIARLGLAARVVCLDHVPQDELYALTQGCQVGVMLYRPVGPNKVYCAPNKLYEYMMCGLPLVCWEHPHLTELVRTQMGGECIPVITPPQIAGALDRVCRRWSPEMGSRLRGLFLQAHCFERHWEREGPGLLSLAP